MSRRDPRTGRRPPRPAPAGGDWLAEAILALARNTASPAPALTWMAGHLRTAERRILTAADRERMDVYRGGAIDLHELLPTVTGGRRARWWISPITAQHGTPMVFGYLAAPEGRGTLAIGYACGAPTGILGPVGPSLVTADGMNRPAGCNDAEWHELRVTASIVLRALMLDLGERAP